MFSATSEKPFGAIWKDSLNAPKLPVSINQWKDDYLPNLLCAVGLYSLFTRVGCGGGGSGFPPYVDGFVGYLSLLAGAFRFMLLCLLTDSLVDCCTGVVVQVRIIC